MIALFWSLRFAYWSSVYEEPFSDMADFIGVALGLLRDGSFASDGFWRTYKAPTITLMMAASSIGSDTFNFAAWRVLQTLFLFASMAWLARELVIATGSRWTGLALIACVAICRPSIFWSYKPASESVAEGFVYLLLALWLAFARKGTWRYACLLGVACVVATLARPNFAVAIGIFGLAVIVHARASSAASGRRAAIAGAFIAGVVLAWTPWIARSYALYGGPVLASTQGPYSFLWEMGEVSVTLPDGSRLRTDVNRMQEEAPRLFRNDYEASRFASQVAWAWLRENTGTFASMVPERMWRQISDRTEHLTKLPRKRLFPSMPEPLLDKRASLVLAGLLGLGLFSAAYGIRFLPLLGLPVAVWFLSALFNGYSRMYDPLAPITLYGIFAAGFAIWRFRKQRRTGGTIAGTPAER